MPSRSPRARGIDINILPEQYRARLLPWRTIAIWLAVVVLLLLTLVFLRFYAGTRGEVARLEAEIEVVDRALRETGKPMAEMPALSLTLSQTLSLANQLAQTYETVLAERIDWHNVMETIVSHAPPGIHLSSIVQAGDTITVRGTGGDEAMVAAYVNALEKSGLFKEVRLLSTSRVPLLLPSPGITVTPSPPPTLPAPTTLDQYEIDDFSPKLILLGEAQLHNFHPRFDVDLVTFMAKGGHAYRVSTSQLALGVDTILDVFVAGATYTNDDRGIGDLGSSVEFQVTTGPDVPAQIRVRNRGQYGSDKTYLVWVEETGLADPYELDDIVPKPISIGETQVHNFYPSGDVDKVILHVKAGRRYSIATASLAIGVDTQLEAVTPDSATYTNDDINPGNLASMISFTATSPGVVTVTITNLDRYGPDKTYEISVYEHGYPTPTPDPAPSSTVTSGAIFQSLPGGYSTPSILLGRREGQGDGKKEISSSPARDRYKIGLAALHPMDLERPNREVQERVEFVISLTLKK